MTQIAVKLPNGLVQAIDRLVDDGVFASRSAAVRRSLEGLVAEHQRRVVDQAYEDGYGNVPESEEEMAEAMRLAVASVHDEPWERWW